MSSNTNNPIQKPPYFYRTVVLLLMLIFGGFMVSDMYLPALPHLMGAFHTTSKYVKLTITVYFVGSCITMLILGPISDRFGRRKIVIFGLIIMIIGTFCCCFAKHYDLFLIGRILQGLGAGASFAAKRTVIRDMISGNDLAHVLAYVSMIAVICPAVAPALGGVIVTMFGWRMIFLVTLSYYCFLLLLILFSFPETLAKATQIKNRSIKVVTHAFAALTNAEFIFYCITSAMVFAGLMAYTTTSPIIIEMKLHYSPFAFGLISLGIVISGQISKIYNRLYLKRKGYRFMILVGITLLCISSVSLFICALCHLMNIYVIVIPMIIYSNGLGILLPNLSISYLSIFTTIIGMASALYGTIQMAGGMIGSAVIAHFSENTLLPIGATLFTFVLIATISLAIAFHLSKKTCRKKIIEDQHAYRYKNYTNSFAAR